MGVEESIITLVLREQTPSQVSQREFRMQELLYKGCKDHKFCLCVIPSVPHGQRKCDLKAWNEKAQLVRNAFSYGFIFRRDISRYCNRSFCLFVFLFLFFPAMPGVFLYFQFRGFIIALAKYKLLVRYTGVRGSRVILNIRGAKTRFTLVRFSLLPSRPCPVRVGNFSFLLAVTLLRAFYIFTRRMRLFDDLELSAGNSSARNRLNQCHCQTRPANR